MTIIIWLLSILTVAAFLLLMWCCMVLAKQADEESEACFRGLRNDRQGEA